MDSFFNWYNKLTDYLEAGFTTGIVSFGVADFKYYVSNNLSDNVQARIARTKSSDGWQESITRDGDKLDAKDLAAARLSLNWDINPDAKLLIQAKHIVDKFDNLYMTVTGDVSYKAPVAAQKDLKPLSMTILWLMRYSHRKLRSKLVNFFMGKKYY